MTRRSKTKAELIEELVALRTRLGELQRAGAARQPVEETLRRSEARYRTLFDHSIEAIYLYDLETRRLLAANPAWHALTGYAPADLPALTLYDLVAHDRASIDVYAAQLRVSRGLDIGERRWRRKDGQLIDVLVSAGTLREDDRTLAFVVARDLTVRKRVEAGFEEAQQRYRQLFEEAPVMCVITAVTAGGEPMIVDCNAAFERAIGCGREELIGRSLAHVYAPDSAVDLLDGGGYARALRGEFTTEERRLVTRDGRIIETLLRALPLADASGRVTGTCGMYVDITERKAAEEALRRSEASNRDLIEQAPYGVYRSSPDGRFLVVNRTLVEMLGYPSAEELLAVDIARDVYADPGARARLVQQYAASERIEEVEVDWRRKDGMPITVRLKGRLVREQGGEPPYFEMMVEDVTERRALEAQLRQAQKMEAIGQLTGGVAHDFNNILTAILANADLVSTALPAEAHEQRAELEDLRLAARRGADMVRKLLAFSRRAKLDLATVDLRSIVTESSRVLRRLLPENIEIRAFHDEAPCFAHADPGAVEQILMNLATNARDAMPQGGILRVETRRARLDAESCAAQGFGEPGEYVRLSISDMGIGMDQTTKAKLFEPFFTTKPQGQGTGLGMAMVYGLVKQHRGFIHVYSEVGQGTTLRIYFPLAQASPSARREEGGAAPARGGTETILLAEDEEAIRRAAKRVLERHGYTVLLAGDGEEALALYRAHEGKIDLVFTDLVMPRLGGRELVERLGQDGHRPRVLFTSGYAASEVRERTTLEPRAPFLEKPWTIPDLLAGVREALDGPGTVLA